MLTIRPDQMEVLARFARESYVRQVRRKLLHLFPGDPRLVDAAAARQRIDDAIQHAETHGIREQRAVTLFVFLFHEFGPGFEKHPSRRWMERILADGEMDAQEKMDVIYERLNLAVARP